MNDKVKYIYEGPVARNFSFTFLMQPNNAGDNAKIQAWIKRMKKMAAPDGGERETFWTFPDFVQLSWPKLDKLFKTGTLAINSITVNYTPDGLWSEHTGGLPTATRVSISYTELDYATKQKIEADW